MKIYYDITSDRIYNEEYSYINDVKLYYSSSIQLEVVFTKGAPYDPEYSIIPITGTYTCVIGDTYTKASKCTIKSIKDTLVTLQIANTIRLDDKGIIEFELGDCSRVSFHYTNLVKNQDATYSMKLEAIPPTNIIYGSLKIPTLQYISAETDPVTNAILISDKIDSVYLYDTFIYKNTEATTAKLQIIHINFGASYVYNIPLVIKNTFTEPDGFAPRRSEIEMARFIDLDNLKNTPINWVNN